MKPLLIFQYKESLPADQRILLFKIIEEGIEKGCLVIDDSVTILSFDEYGKLNYCTP